MKTFPRKRPGLCVLLLAVLGLAACSATSSSFPSAPEAARLAGESDLQLAARQIMTAAGFCALVTVDETGALVTVDETGAQVIPRARTIDPSEPDQDFVVRFVTHPATRKVAQLERNSRVVLYYFDPDRREYATLYGTAVPVQGTEAIKRHWQPKWDAFYPDRPQGVRVYEVLPERVEVLGRGFEPDPDNWRPQGIDFSQRLAKQQEGR